MSTEATTGDKRKAEEQTVTATDDDAKKQKLGDEALTKESEVDTTVSESNIIPEGTERNAKPAAGELAEPEDEDEEKADKKEVEADADADAGAEEQEDEEEDVEEEEEGRRPRRRAAQKAEGYYGTDAAKAALGPNDNEEEDEDDEEVQPGDLTGITEGDDDEDEEEDEEEAEEK